jgi:hypothetical protein
MISICLLYVKKPGQKETNEKKFEYFMDDYLYSNRIFTIFSFVLFA